jgi:DNA repair exonuclease SbcCD ATPase subunit
LEKIRGKAAECSQAEIEKMREGDQETIDGLRSELQKMDGQLVAAAKNTAHYRKEEQKAQDSLIRIQAENTRLVERVDELTATHEYDVIQLDDTRTKLERLQAVEIDLEGAKAELYTLKASHKQLSTEHTRLSDKLVEAKETIAQLQDKSIISNDRLEEQQGLTAQLEKANMELEEMGEKVQKLEIKVANAETAEKTVTTSFKHRSGELKKDLEKAYKRIEKLDKTVVRLRKREQERMDLEGAAKSEKGDVIDLTLVD